MSRIPVVFINSDLTNRIGSIKLMPNMNPKFYIRYFAGYYYGTGIRAAVGCA